MNFWVLLNIQNAFCSPTRAVFASDKQILAYWPIYYGVVCSFQIRINLPILPQKWECHRRKLQNNIMIIFLSQPPSLPWRRDLLTKWGSASLWLSYKTLFGSKAAKTLDQAGHTYSMAHTVPIFDLYWLPFLGLRERQTNRDLTGNRMVRKTKPREAISTIPPKMLQNVYRNMKTHLRFLVIRGGANFEH